VIFVFECFRVAVLVVLVLLLLVLLVLLVLGKRLEISEDVDVIEGGG